MNALIAMSIFGAFMVLTIVLGLLSMAGRGKLDLENWSVGGRNFGAVLIWVLLAGEIYTAFSYLGIAGWGYAYGAPVYYEFAYLACGIALTYFVAPMMWGYAKRHNLISLSDIIAFRFESKGLGALSAILVTIFILPYVQLNIMGLGVVVHEVSYGAIDLQWGYVISFVVGISFVLSSGLRGSAWAAVLKDVMVIGTLLGLAIYLPQHLFGGYGELFDRLMDTHKEWMTLPGHDSGGLGLTWFASTTIVNSIGLSCFPAILAGYLGASSGKALRRTAIFLPFYQVLLFIPILLGMAALFVIPKLSDSNLAMLALVIHTLPPWAVGLIGVAAGLSSIVTNTVSMLVIGTMWGKNVLGTTPRTAPYQKPLSQVVVFVAGGVALVLALAFPSTLVNLSIISYQGVTQFAPILILGLIYRPMTRTGAVSGLAVGVIVDCVLVFSGHSPWHGINAGLIALVVNVAVNLSVSHLQGRERAAAVRRPELLATDEVVAP